MHTPSRNHRCSPHEAIDTPRVHKVYVLPPINFPGTIAISAKTKRNLATASTTQSNVQNWWMHYGYALK